MTGKARNWSAAGAARFAREARIATAGYLRSAPVARRWHMSKLLNAYGLHLQHTGSPEQALGLLLGGIGYRPPYPPGWDEITEMVLADEASDLAAASLYILTPQMCDVTVAAAQTLTPEDLALLAEDDLPSPAGLVVLPQPLLVSAVTGDLGDDRAYRWRSPARIQPLSAGRHLRRTVPAVRMSLYHDAHGPVRPDTFIAYESAARAAGTPLPPLILDAMRAVPLGYHATQEQEEDLKRFTGAARSTGEATRELYASEGLDENRVTGEYTPGSQIDDADDLFMAKFLFAFWRLCEQRIAVTEAAGIPHSARVLADKAGVAPDVRIIRLRRPVQPGADGPAGGRDWQHRWVVRMHKVRQWYPSEQRHKVLYRGPYIKGPEGKPMLGGEAVHGLIR